jgi:pSer/pThr/pTyr-binding forkhead associated (FHA) protein
MKICLVVAEGTHAGAEVPVTKFPFVIGRTPKCNLRPASEMVSKQHCALIIHQGKLYVKDMGSRNGTFINGKRIEKTAVLRHGDGFQVGPLSFKVSITETVSVNQPTPLPPTKDSDPNLTVPTEDEVAALLLEMDAAEEPAEEGTGNTMVLDLQKPDGPREVVKAPEGKAKPTANSSVAAQDLLKKLIRGGQK